jgi:hypothetical protein
MNASSSRRDNLIGVAAVIVLLLGTATGSALVMLDLSVAMLIVLTLFYRKRIGTGARLTAFVAAVASGIIAIVISMR